MLVQDRPATGTLAQVRAEYLDVPGLKLTERQAQRLFQLDGTACEAVLNTLVDVGFLCRTDDGVFIRFQLAPPRFEDCNDGFCSSPLPDSRRYVADI